MVDSEIRELIEIKAAKYNLDPDLIEAHILTESSGNSNSTRYEPAFYEKYIKNNISKWKITLQEAHDRATSYGLLQIMLQVAREMGFTGQATDLLIPEVGLEWGCKKLSKCYEKFGQKYINAGIAAYNCGTPKLTPTGFVNQRYVDRVNGFLNKIREERK